MNIYFSGIGGNALGPLAELAQDAGHHVQGSDPQETPVVTQLVKRGITVSHEQKGLFLESCHKQQPVDWLVYSSALPEDHPELVMARMLGIKATKRDKFLSLILEQTGLKLIAVAGTHGKTGTTALLAWVFMQLNIPISYSIGTTITFGPGGKYDPKSEYFIYECDEYDRNFLHFHPHLSLIMSLDYDHPDTYSSPQEYLAAFRQFAQQSHGCILWKRDGTLLQANDSWELRDDEIMDFTLPGQHTRRNATIVAKALERLNVKGDYRKAINSFPGADRRFERLAPNLYTDYGHHPTEIAATLQMAHEVNSHVVLIYQPHQNLRQHEIRNQYVDCFELAETVYWLPTFLTREDPTLPILAPDELTENVTNIDSIYTADLDDELWETIQRARDENKLVLFMGAGTIDNWVRSHAATTHAVNILIIDQEGNFILRHQQGSHEILTAFGDAVKSSDASQLIAAARVAHQAIDVAFETTDIALFKMFSQAANPEAEKTYTTYYILTGIDSTSLRPKDGEELSIVNPNKLGEYPLSIFTRTVIAEYTHPPLTY